MPLEPNDFFRSNYQVNEEGKIVRITRAPLERVNITRPQYVASPEQVEPLPLPERQQTLYTQEKSVWAKIGLYGRLARYLFITITGIVMKNWKTTVGAIVAGIATALNAFGVINIPTEVQMYIVGVAVFIIGLFAGDAKKAE